MRYEGIEEGVFLLRSSRFTALVDIDGRRESCHLKSTARLGELLIPGARIHVQKINSKSRRTKYDVIAVQKEGQVINIDSLAPNKIFLEWVQGGGFMEGVKSIKAEAVYDHSRLDFYLEAAEKAFVEVKGVTLESGGLGLFPDAPTPRGIKHIEALIGLKAAGFGSHLVFVAQMKGVSGVAANCATHEAFYQALLKARDAGVTLHAMDCLVTKDSIVIDQRLPVLL